MSLATIRADLHSTALWAGFTAFLWYAFGALPLHIAVSGQLGLTPAQTSSWIFIVWFTGAVSSIVLSVLHRQPIPITWTIPGLVYLGTLRDQFTFAELVAANLVAGVAILGLGLAGVGGRIMKWLPMSIVMGMFAGSVLGYVTRMVEATVQDVAVAGVTVLGYLVARVLAAPRVPPVGLAVVFGGAATLFLGRAAPEPIAWALPDLGIAAMSFSLSAVFAVSLPLVVLAMGLGNVQGLGFLLAQGYRVPINRVSTVVGVNSVINALFGGHPATVARTAVAMMASSEAGPEAGRYWSTVVAAALTIVMAFAAAPVASLINVLPGSYVVTLAGLAILTALQDAFERAFASKLRFGALVALAVAATPFQFVGITSAFWAVVAGLVASGMAERRQLLEYWRAR